ASFLPMAPFVFLVASQSHLLIHALYGARYLPATGALAIAMLTIPAAAFTAPAMSVVYAIDGITFHTLLYMLIPVCLDLLISASAIPIWGVTAAACANLATQWSMALLLTLYVKRRHGFSPPFNFFGRVLLGSLVSAGLSGVIASFLGEKAGIIAPVIGAAFVLMSLRELRVFSEPEFVMLQPYFFSKLPKRFHPIVQRGLDWMYVHRLAT